MIRTLYAQLSLVLLGLLGSTGTVYGVMSIWAAELYVQEIHQKLHMEVARHLVEEQILLKNNKVNHKGLEHIFHMMMVINPGIEIYLLDPRGRILEYSAPPGKLQTTAVDLGPIFYFLESPAPQLPLTGDDPRFPGAKRAFSAARIGSEEAPEGYLYVVLGGERYTSIVQRLSASHILRMSSLALVGSVILAILLGLMTFRLLTSRLRRLRRAMETFEETCFTQPVPLVGFAQEGQGDEIDDLAATFTRLSQTVSHHLELARGTDSLRRKLVANVSHDLRTPLASLSGFLETLLLKDAELSSSDRHRYLELAHRHSRSLGHRVDRLFELAKLEAREIEPQFESFPLGELVQDVTQKFELQAKGNRVQINTHTPSDLPFVLADLGLIERVLDNLIENAIRHTPEGGTVTVSIYRQPHNLILEVSDTGEGIAEKEIPFVFRRFYTAKTNLNETSRTGLGLAIAQNIAQLHGSRIDVHSQLGEGTTFRLPLPVMLTSATSASAPSSSAPGRSNSSNDS